MRSLLFILSTCSVMGLAFWAYHENYQTQQSLRDVSDLQREIGDLHVELGVLRAEWAYLNRPDRLRELASINFDRLGLLPLTPQQFGRVDEVPFPSSFDVNGMTTFDVVGTLEQRP